MNLKVEILPHEHKKDVFIILIDEKPWKEIHASIFGNPPRLKMNDVSQFPELEMKAVKVFTLKRLAQRNDSSYGISKLLKERLVTRETIATVISELQSRGYINDQDWITSYIRKELQKKQGPKTLAAKLKAKGIPDALIDGNLKVMEPEFPQSERIKALLEGKYRNRNLADYKERHKIIAALLRKGFDLEEIRDSLDN